MPRASVIALFGPTGIGKTAVAVALAARLRAAGEQPVAVSCDALQVYRGLETLTGAAAPAERAALEHRLISFLDPSRTFSAGAFAALAHREIDELLAAGRRPIVVGGTGLYLRAALTELSLRPPPPPGVRERWSAELAAHGPARLHAVLAERAPAVAAGIAPGDRHRIVRALELLEAGDRPGGGSPADRGQLWSAHTRHPTLLAGLTMRREDLYARIETRVDAMVAAGAEAEVRRVAAASGGVSDTARAALGFRELLDGDVAGMRRRTRQYARRQLTWMRKLAGVRVIDVSDRDPDDVAGEIAAVWRAGVPGSARCARLAP